MDSPMAKHSIRCFQLIYSPLLPCPFGSTIPFFAIKIYASNLDPQIDGPKQWKRKQETKV